MRFRIIRYFYGSIALALGCAFLSSILCGIRYRSGALNVTLATGRLHVSIRTGLPKDIRYFDDLLGDKRGWSMNLDQLFSGPFDVPIVRMSKLEDRSAFHFLGINVMGPFGRITSCHIQLPLILLLLISGVMYWTTVKVARFIPQKGKCSRCGYDLRGCEGARCSECGTDKSQWFPHIRAGAVVRLLEIVGALATLLATLVLVTYVSSPGPPRIILAIGGNLEFLRPVDEYSSSVVSKTLAVCDGDHALINDELLYINGHCDRCWRPRGMPPYVVFLKAESGLLMATVESSAAGHNHFGPAKPVHPGMIAGFGVLSSFLIVGGRFALFATCRWIRSTRM